MPLVTASSMDDGKALGIFHKTKIDGVPLRLFPGSCVGYTYLHDIVVQKMNTQGSKMCFIFNNISHSQCFSLNANVCNHYNFLASRNKGMRMLACVEEARVSRKGCITMVSCKGYATRVSTS